MLVAKVETFKGYEKIAVVNVFKHPDGTFGLEDGDYGGVHSLDEAIEIAEGVCHRTATERLAEGLKTETKRFQH